MKTQFEITATATEQTATLSSVAFVGRINGQSYGSGKTEAAAIAAAAKLLAAAVIHFGVKGFAAKLAAEAA